jgi:glycosyltransferase involved in cell wall biosynthesis
VIRVQRLRLGFVDYVVDPARPGRSGLSDVVWGMGAALARQGHEVYVAGSYSVDDYPDPGVQVLNLRLPAWSYRNFATQCWLVERAGAALRAVRPAVVHAPEYISTAVLAGRRAMPPVILTVPGNIFHRLTVPAGHGYEWWYVWMLKGAARRSARHCAAVVAISREMRDWWIRTGSEPTRTPLIPIGADTSRFRPVPAARSRLGIPRDRPLFLYVGRFSQEKGIDILLRAVAAIGDTWRRTGAQLMLIGRGPMAAEMGEFIASAGLQDLVSQLPWIDQDALPLWYSAADAVVLPSRTEGMSRTIPEAFLCGTPVIGTAISGTVDHVEPGVRGMLCSLGDVPSLSAALEAASRRVVDLRRMREGCRAYALAHLTWDAVAERLVREVYVPCIRAGTPAVVEAEGLR